MRSSDTPARRRCTHRLPGYLLVSLALLFAAHSSAAQEDRTSPDSPTMTLHVYTNLIQIPVLILGPYLDYAPTFDPKKLTVTLDKGKPFHPVHIRPEGDDPIALAILLDVSDDQADPIPEFANALAKLASRSLHPHDTVAIYAIDCTTIQVSAFAPPDPAQLKLAGDRAARFQTARTNKHRRNCGDQLRIRDTIGVIANHLWHQDGRRAILAISRGVDVGSTLSGEDIHQIATSRGVAIFGLTPVPISTNINRSFHGGSIDVPTGPIPPPIDFKSLCEVTGGIVRPTPNGSLGSSLMEFVKTLRERTIIEFPRPQNATAGTHGIKVEIAKSRDFIRPAGISVPTPDAKILADPTTILQENLPPPDQPPAAATPTPPQ